jgi:hypothetical protein
MHLAKGAKHKAIELLDKAREEMPDVTSDEGTSTG